MPVLRCPGQDIRFWKPDDVFTLRCPYCGTDIEFWKDDPVRACPNCRKQINNPRRNLSCAKWCKFASECLGIQPDTIISDAPLIERLTALLTTHFAEEPDRMKSARNVSRTAETIVRQEGGEPYLAKSAAMLAGALLKSAEDVKIADYTPLLGEAGLDEAAIEKVCLIVEAVLTGTSCDITDCNILIECHSVWDAVQLERLAMMQRETDFVAVDALIGNLKTESGKQLTTNRVVAQ